MGCHASAVEVQRCARTLLAIIVAFTTSGFAAPARKVEAPRPSESAVAAQRLWSKLLTRCGESSFYVSSYFDRSGMIATLQVAKNPVLEFKGLRFNAVPIPLSPAEKLNGISSRTRLTMIADVWREEGGRWANGPAFQPRNTDDVFAHSLGTFAGDMFGLGLGGAMAFELVKYNGKWVVARSSVSRTGAIGLSSDYFDLDTIVATPADRWDCATRKVIPRPPTPEEAAVLAAEAKAKAEKEAAERERAEAARERAEQERKDKESFEQYIAERRKKMEPWSYHGGLEGFDDALAANLAKRAAQYGFDPKSYAAEATAVHDIIAQCLTLTAEDVAKSEAYVAQKGFGPQARRDQYEMLKYCGGGRNNRGEWGYLLSPAGKPWGMGVETHMLDLKKPEARGWVLSPALRVRITVLPTREEIDRHPRMTTDDQHFLFDVIDAEIPYPPTARAGL